MATKGDGQGQPAGIIPIGGWEVDFGGSLVTCKRFNLAMKISGPNIHPMLTWNQKKVEKKICPSGEKKIWLPSELSGE